MADGTTEDVIAVAAKEYKDAQAACVAARKAVEDAMRVMREKKLAYVAVAYGVREGSIVTDANGTRHRVIGVGYVPGRIDPGHLPALSGQPEKKNGGWSRLSRHIGDRWTLCESKEPECPSLSPTA